MALRALLILFAVIFTGLPADAALYQRGENFRVIPRNWRLSQLDLFYGFQKTRITGGRGAAGGYLRPSTLFNSYADIYLNAGLQRGTPFSASGRLVVANTSVQPPYGNAAFIGHFGRQTEPFVNTVGLAVVGSSAGSLSLAAVVQFADGTAFVGNAIRVQVSAFRVVDWSYQWNPAGGLDGAGQVSVQVGTKTSAVDVPASARGKDFVLDAFGIYQPRFRTPEINAFVELYVGQLAYTAGAGNPPAIRVRGTEVISAGGAPITKLRGTARVLPGNRIKAVRYRLVRNGKPGRTRPVTGTTNWSARFRLPPGTSRIQILARSDSGLLTTVERGISRLR